MKYRFQFLIICVSALMLATQANGALSKKEYQESYDILSQDLLNNVGELGTIVNFTYQKDIATFTFDSGTVHMLRYVNGRPTTAIFVGKGKVDITVPMHTQKQGLWCISGDSVVSEEFTTCFIRMADDLDLELKKRFTFAQKELDWKVFNSAKQAQGEQFFRPLTYHDYDNYFQLLRSAYERSSDGYFWIDFNRYVFSFDPNRPEGVRIAYETEGGDIVVKEGVALQRKEHGIADNNSLSNVDFPTTPLSRTGNLRMSGADGSEIDSAVVQFSVLYNADSSNFVTLFLDFHLKLDALALNGKPVDFHRRRDFNAISVVLPSMAHTGDTLNFTMTYHGSMYTNGFPWVENPAVTPYTMTFQIPKGFNYLMPDMSDKTADGKYETFTVNADKYDNFYFNSYATGFDTIPQVLDAGIPLNFLKSSFINKNNFACYLPDETYQSQTLGTVNYLTSLFGTPPGAFALYVFPVNNVTMPGVMGLPQISCSNEGSNLAVGGFYMIAGKAAGKQWFGSAMRPKTDHEKWFSAAAPEYLGLLAIQNLVGGGAFYSNLINRRDSLFRINGFNRDMPLAMGSLCDDTTLANKGVWLLHMLRFMTVDLGTGSDDKFLSMMNTLSMMTNSSTFTNEDIKSAAETTAGMQLDQFFEQWLYSRNYPSFDVTYSIAQKADGWYVDGTVAQSGMGNTFEQPVICRITGADGVDTFVRHTVTGANSNFSFGPYAAQPKEFTFNEFMSVLSRDKIKKQ